VDRLPVGWDEGPGLVASAWRFRWLVATVALAGALAAVGVSTLQPVMYEATSKILLAPPPSGDSTAQAEPDRYVRNQAAFITSPPVLQRTVRTVKGRVTVKQLRKRLVAEPSKESDLVTVRVRDATARGSVELATALGQAYEQTAVEHDRAGAAKEVAHLQDQQRQLQDRLNLLDAQLRDSPSDATRAARAVVADELVQVVRRTEEARLANPGRDPVALREQAELPEQPAQPQPLRLAAIGGLLGVVLGAGLAWGLAWRRRPAAPADHPAQPQRGQGGPPAAATLLGEIPDFAELARDGQVPTATDPDSGPGKAYRALAATLQSVLDHTGVRTVAVTSPDPGDGKTLTSLNLAVALGESGRHVVLVDADERRRGLSRLCDLDGQPGLTDLAVESTPIDYCLWLPTFTSIQVIPAGHPIADSAGFVRGRSFSRAMLQVRQHASLALVDTPALLAAPDALAVAEHVEGVILVVQPDTSAVAMIEARRRLDGAGARLLGIVINRNGSRHGGLWSDGDGDGHEPALTTKGRADQPMQLPAAHAKEGGKARESGRRSGGKADQPAEQAMVGLAEPPGPAGAPKR
jgi:Mrp family chromosome partitioning ATPase/LPS O-antigen subunit length determinant protein (WzzB/FepE family)